MVVYSNSTAKAISAELVLLYNLVQISLSEICNIIL